MRDTADRSSLSHPGFHRQDFASPAPAVRPSCRVTTGASPKFATSTTSELREEFGGRNPFMLPSKLTYDGFDTAVLIASVLFVSTIAGMLAFLVHGGRI